MGGPAGGARPESVGGLGSSGSDVRLTAYFTDRAKDLTTGQRNLAASYVQGAVEMLIELRLATRDRWQSAVDRAVLFAAGLPA